MTNSIFKEVFTQEKTILPPKSFCYTPTMPDFDINVVGVTKLLSDLNPHKATGPDGIPAQILKLVAGEIAPALSLYIKNLWIQVFYHHLGFVPMSLQSSKRVIVP